MLRPTIIEPLPTLESTGNDAWRVLVDVIMQHGAPYLPRMDFEEPYALRCLPHLTAMTELVLRDVSFDVAVVLEEVIENAAAGGPPVFPALEELNVYYDGKEGDDWFFRALGRADAPRLTKLRIGFLCSIDEVFETTAVAVGEIMAAGPFPSLQDLRFLDMDDDELAMIMPGLAAGACAHTLQTLEIFYGSFVDGSGLMALGQALGAGRFPELRLLEFHNYQIDAAGMEALVAALSAAEGPQLEVLSLFSTNMGDEGIKSLAVALRAGRLGSRLRELTLGNDFAHTTESGCLTLLTATMEGQENLTCLSHVPQPLVFRCLTHISGMCRSVCRGRHVVLPIHHTIQPRN